ncbi:MAG TPA: hypothetical protein VIP77_10675 [Jiangellaceae bacterium]
MRAAARWGCGGATVVLAVAGCSSDGGGSGASGGSTPLPQPVVSDLDVAPEQDRVDLEQPSFSDPTEVTNPLFPVAVGDSTLLLGTVDDLPFRAEVTVLPDTRVIDWDGRRIETAVSQYAAFLDGRIHEVALDLYAQDDSGAVWYFGEDVYNYEDGVIADTEGTWHAGTDGPAAMIMPAEPQPGDVYRPENIPEVVFEEVTVESTGEKVDGPRGPIEGAVVVDELHQDGAHETKTFAPGYGEFYTAADGEIEALAEAVPTDAVAGGAPAELDTMTSAPVTIFDAVRAGDLAAASAALGELTDAWTAMSAGDVPPLVADEAAAALDELTTALSSASLEAAQAAIAMERSALDLALPYRDVVATDLARLELLVRQLLVDVSAGDAPATAGDLTTIDWIRARFAHSLASPDVSEIDEALGVVRASAVAGDAAAIDAAVPELHDLLTAASE